METKKVITNSLNENIVLVENLLFEWKCEEKETRGRKIIYSFSRDDTKPYYQELVALEKEYKPFRMKTLLPSYIASGVAFLLFTLFFILYLIDKNNFTLYFLTVSVPGIVVLTFSGMFILIRYIAINKLNKELNETNQKYAEKVKEIKSKY